MVEAAFDVIAIDGFEGLRMRGIAARVGADRSTIHHYFASKEALVEAVAEYAADQFRGTTPVTGSATERLIGHLQTLAVRIVAEPKLGYRHEGAGVTVDFADGTSDRGTLVVGADGARSRVRRQLLPDAEIASPGGFGVGGRLYLTDATRQWLPQPLQRSKNMILPPSDFLFTAVLSTRCPRSAAWAATWPCATPGCCGSPRSAPVVAGHRASEQHGDQGRVAGDRGPVRPPLGRPVEHQPVHGAGPQVGVVAHLRERGRLIAGLERAPRALVPEYATTRNPAYACARGQAGTAGCRPRAGPEFPGGLSSR
ncbi:MAG: TetR family transcriptional regulator [Streptosporangiaceae bacterium]